MRATCGVRLDMDQVPATLMVHLELGRPNPGLLQMAGDLAERFHAGVIGIRSSQRMPVLYGDSIALLDAATR